MLLIDEDQCATNFMVRDVNMDKLVRDKTVNEPITPFISKIGALHSQLGVSSILVIGGVGSYFQVADRVILMDHYKPSNVTLKAKGLITDKMREFKQFGNVTPRYLTFDSFSDRRVGRDFKIRVNDGNQVRFGDEALDLGLCSQIVERGQLVAMTRILQFIKHSVLSGKGKKRRWTVSEAIDAAQREMDRDYTATKMDVLTSKSNKNNKFVRPRRHEVAAALNRLRSLIVYSDAGSGNMTAGHRVKEEEEEDWGMEVEVEGDGQYNGNGY